MQINVVMLRRLIEFESSLDHDRRPLASNAIRAAPEELTFLRRTLRAHEEHVADGEDDLC